MCSEKVKSIPIFDVVLDAHGAANLYRSFEDSVVGVFVPTWQKLEIGRLVVVSIELSGEAPVLAHAVVQFLRASTGNALWPGLGLAFVSLTDNQRDALERFAQRRPPMLYDL